MMDGALADTVHSTQSSPSTAQVHFLLSDRYSGNHASQSAPCISSPSMASDSTPPPPPPVAVQSDGLHSLPVSRLSLSPVSSPPSFHPSPSTHALEPESPSSTRNPSHRLRPNRARNRRNRSLYQRVREFLGHGNPSRRRIVDAYSSLVYCFVQIIIVATFVGLTRSVWRSPRPIDHGRSEWDACGKPLGPLAIVWIIRTALGVYMTTWSFIRTRQRIEPDLEGRPPETPRTSRRVSTHPPAVPDGPSMPNNTPPQPRSTTISVTAWDRLYDQVQTLVSLIVIAHFLATNVLLYSSVNTCRISSPHLWWLSFAILCITYVVILEILLICLTVFVLMPILFVVLNLFLICTGHRPISARQLIDPAHINPETPKMPQKLVDKIPLVLYIPIRSSSPVEVPPTESTSSPNVHVSHANAELAADGSVEGRVNEYAYPPGAIKVVELPPEPAQANDVANDQREPESATITASPSSTAGAGPSSSPTIANPSTGAVSKRPRFAIFRRQSSPSGASVPVVKSATSAKGKASSRRNSKHSLMKLEADDEWENTWEKSEFPFIRLEGNRAACAICLMDFSEPPKKKQPSTAAASKNISHPPSSNNVTAPAQLEPDATGTGTGDEGAEIEPLRLLECGHVFHKPCLDPWLTGVSGRCPTCQKKVEITEKSVRSRTSRRP